MPARARHGASGARYDRRVNDLPGDSQKALKRARDKRVSYAVEILRTPDGRTLAILGEAHMKLAEAAEIGRAVVSTFALRGVETFQRDKVFCGRALGVVIQAPRTLLQILMLGRLKGSTITDAKQLPDGWTVELERAKKMPFGLHVTALYMTVFFTVSFMALLIPLIAPFVPWLAALIAGVAIAFQAHMLMLIPAFFFRRQTWSWLLHPFLGILTLRDHLMVDGTVRMFADHPRQRTAVVVMGRAHVSGYSTILVEKHGYTRVTEW